MTLCLSGRSRVEVGDALRESLAMCLERRRGEGGDGGKRPAHCDLTELPNQSGERDTSTNRVTILKEIKVK